MAGPQVQHTQRPNSAYYTGLNGSGGSSGAAGGGGGGVGGGMASSASHTGLGLHALRQVSNETELIYRGSHNNGTVNELPGVGQGRQMPATTSNRIIQQQPAHSSRDNIVSSIAGTGSCATDTLIGTIATSAGAGNSSALTALNSSGIAGSSTGVALKKSNTQRSIEIIVDASQCGKDVVDIDDVEQGEGGGQESSSSIRKSSRHRHRPLHRRLISYLRSLFQGSAAQNDSELEEFETPARYRPDSLSALSRATRFTEDEIKRIYRGFKAECPTGVVKEDTFKVIYSQFFPQGANPTLYAHYVFNTLDQDHSGIVSFEDFVQGLSILSRGSVEEKLRWTFSLYDINGDGFITREEMTDIVTAIYELMGRLPDECPEEEKIKGKVEHIFQKMDINRDGVVTLEEFLEACRNDEAISRSMSYTARRRQRSRSQKQQQQQQQPNRHHQQTEPEKRKSNFKTKQQMQQRHSTRHQPAAKCCVVIDMDDASTTTTTTTTASINNSTSNNNNNNYKNYHRPKKLNGRIIDSSNGDGQQRQKWKEEYDEDEEEEEDGDGDEDGDEDESADDADLDDFENDGHFMMGRSQRSRSICRHCLRPQSELQSRQVTGVRLRKSHSKSRQRKRSKSKQRHHHHLCHNYVGPRALPRWPELNVANEQAIRFRCPQVGPQVGRDLHTPQPMHFHHPQQLCHAGQAQVQAQIQAQSQVTPKPAKSKNKQKHRHNKQFQCPATSGATALSSIATAAASPLPQPQAPPPHPPHPHPPLPVALVTLEIGATDQGPTELPSTPDSPSLVTVSTWYTVAKQGVSC
ncbi:uncharacterized protein LOC117779675 [Drosophila innubila]|uniref:uncharacterized protein LOC117779675 n=1 Tax=Drosophila innubila TaxID=198719 RepID=UPI00148D454F|nr:uncharacterized protein LOC117779675 [Drosophila innubila]